MDGPMGAMVDCSSAIKASTRERRPGCSSRSRSKYGRASVVASSTEWYENVSFDAPEAKSPSAVSVCPFVEGSGVDVDATGSDTSEAAEPLDARPFPLAILTLHLLAAPRSRLFLRCRR